MKVGEKAGYIKRTHEDIRVDVKICMVVANVNESNVQCDKNCPNTGCNRPALT